MPESKPVYTIDSVPILSGTVACHACGRTLAGWVQAGRKTVILAPFMLIYRASLICRCGAQTEWYSQLVSAIRLGIDGQSIAPARSNLAESEIRMAPRSA